MEVKADSDVRADDRRGKEETKFLDTTFALQINAWVSAVIGSRDVERRCLGLFGFM